MHENNAKGHMQSVEEDKQSLLRSIRRRSPTVEADFANPFAPDLEWFAVVEMEFVTEKMCLTCS